MTLDQRLAEASAEREAAIRAKYAEMVQEWGPEYPGASAMTALFFDTSTDEVARVVAGAEQHTENPE